MLKQNRRFRAKVNVPLCPIHGTPMRIGRVVGIVQYRYCAHVDCQKSVRTFRRIPVPDLRPTP